MENCVVDVGNWDEGVLGIVGEYWWGFWGVC